MMDKSFNINEPAMKCNKGGCHETNKCILKHIRMQAYGFNDAINKTENFIPTFNKPP